MDMLGELHLACAVGWSSSEQESESKATYSVVVSAPVIEVEPLISGVTVEVSSSFSSLTLILSA